MSAEPGTPAPASTADGAAAAPSGPAEGTVGVRVNVRWFWGAIAIAAVLAALIGGLSVEIQTFAQGQVTSADADEVRVATAGQVRTSVGEEIRLLSSAGLGTAMVAELEAAPQGSGNLVVLHDVDDHAALDDDGVVVLLMPPRSLIAVLVNP